MHMEMHMQQPSANLQAIRVLCWGNKALTRPRLSALPEWITPPPSLARTRNTATAMTRTTKSTRTTIDNKNENNDNDSIDNSKDNNDYDNDVCFTMFERISSCFS